MGENRLLLEGQEVIVVKLGNFLDIVHFFAYRDHILLVLKHGYETGQAATPKINFKFMFPKTIATKQDEKFEFTLKVFEDNQYMIFRQNIQEIKNEAFIADKFGPFKSEKEAKEYLQKIG